MLKTKFFSVIFKSGEGYRLEYKILKVSLTFVFLCKILNLKGIWLDKRIKHKENGTMKLKYRNLY